MAPPATARIAGKAVPRRPPQAHSGRMNPWTITTAPVPRDLDDPDAWALHGASAVHLATDLQHWGYDDITYSARFLLTRLREREYAHRVRLVATAPEAPRRTEAVVGTAYVVQPTRGNTHTAYVELTVHPAHRRHGIGTALIREVERIAAAGGRTTIIGASDQPGEPAPDDPHAMLPPTGSGRVDARSAPAAFAAAHGYELAQSERYSVLELPVDPDVLADLHDTAARRAGAEYRLLAWADRTPDAWLTPMAELLTRMSTDAPLGALDLGEDPWDDDRVRTAEASVADAGHGSLTVAAEHVPTGALAAFTQVEYPRDQPGVLFQEDTLVLPAHRGRRLGMLVKSEMLRRLAEVRPDARRIHTWNAEENEHMLAINVALGFRGVGVCGMWQRRLDVTPAEDRVGEHTAGEHADAAATPAATPAATLPTTSQEKIAEPAS